jgi:hypothetical protein
MLASVAAPLLVSAGGDDKYECSHGALDSRRVYSALLYVCLHATNVSTLK